MYENLKQMAKIKRNLPENEKKRLTYNADCRFYRKAKIHIKMLKKGNEIKMENKNFLLKGVSAGNWWV